MTDQELKDLVASLAVSQAKTDAQMEKTIAQMDKTDAQMEKTIAQMDKTDAQMEKTIAQMDKTDKKLNKVAKMLGNISNNQGDITEEYFVNSLKEKLQLGDIHFDFLVKNFKAQNAKKILAEYDILLVNGKSVAIIEVKYKVHCRDLEILPQKIESLKQLPQYDGYRVYAGLAGFFIPDEVIKEAEEKGYFTLQRKGDIVVTHTQNLKVA